MAAQSALREGSFRNLSAAGQDLAAAGSGYGNYKMATGGTQDMTGALSMPQSNQTSGVNVDPATIAKILQYSNPKDTPYDYKYIY